MDSLGSRSNDKFVDSFEREPRMETQVETKIVVYACAIPTLIATTLIIAIVFFFVVNIVVVVFFVSFIGYYSAANEQQQFNSFK